MDDEVAAAVTTAFILAGDPELVEEIRFALARSLRIGVVEAVQSATAARAAIDRGARLGILALGDADRDSIALLQSEVDPAVTILCVAEADDPDELHQRRHMARQLGVTDTIARDDLSPALLERAVEWALERADLRRALDEAQSRFAVAVQGTRDGFWEWDLRTQRVFYSQRWKEILGYDESDIGSDPQEWFSRVHTLDVARLRADIEAVRRGGKPSHELEYRVLASDGSYRWVLTRGVAMSDSTGRAVRISGSLTDTTPLRKQVEQIREESSRDALTHLPRQDAFMQQLARSVELARDHRDYVFAVLLVELDRFRQLQEGIGPRVSRLLGQVAERLRQCVEPEDVLARFDGPSFAILLPGIDDPVVATQVSDRILQKLEEPFDVDGEPVYVLVNIGMTSSARGYASPDEVMSDVSAAAARADGRLPERRSEMFSTHMRVEAMTMLRLEMSLRTAVERGEFVLHYQPIVDLATRKLLGFEALIRWQHPTRGLVAPGEFIPIAEETGMILPMGRWAVREAARQLAIWRATPEGAHLTVSVNLSGRQTDDPRLARDVLTALEDVGLPPQALRLELTESELMENATAAVELLATLRQHGVRIYMDDFGTGYSSLSYLDRFPVDGLKIDRSFVDVLDGTEESSTMVRTILGLARNFGLDVVAEGIETEIHLQHLQTLGCSTGQGFLISRPVAADIASQLVRGA
jgi:diguanylate cyclase (GGDEF)-like protein/PAS domain S-box-containing protein